MLLLTFDVPFSARAVAFAIGTAVQTGAELLVCDAVPVGGGDPSVASHRSFGYAEARAAVLAEARAAGAHAQEVVFHSPRPVQAALLACRQLGAGLLVLGAEPKRLGRWRYRSVSRRLRRDAPCLVWVGD